MIETNPKVDEFLHDAGRWRAELERLRNVALECRLTEELKWRQPCYTFEGRNIVVLGGFKAYCALGFFKGALLADPAGILIAPGTNSQSGRQIRFTSVHQIDEMAPVLRAYLFEAIEVERAGLSVRLKRTEEFAVPEELRRKLDELPELRAAFDALTPGRQRGYLLHFSAPKQSATRMARIEKCMPRIFEGRGLHDRDR
jgi:uncharacterized protein YdeI (YjbR/CyaY-like superfamily)